MGDKTQSSWEFACEWYTVEALQAYLRHSQSDVPTDVRSDEFAEWLTEQRRLAMARGIMIGEQRQKETGELMLAENNEPVEAALDILPEAEKPELFLFVWDKFCPDYTDGLAVAIAETVEQAQKLVQQSVHYEIGKDEWGPVQKFPVTEPIAFWVNGGG